MNLHRRIGTLLLIITFFILSCDVSSLVAPVPIPTTNPNAVSTIVVLTAGAASTQTALWTLPTLTPTFTPFPSQTPSSTPLPTATFIFASTYIAPTAVGTGGIVSGFADFDCLLQGQFPANGAPENAGTRFVTVWSVRNTGTRQWLHSNIDLVFTGGTNLASYSSNDTGADVPPGSSTSIKVTMTAPASSGTYKSNWSLRAGKTLFCPISVTISVP